MTQKNQIGNSVSSSPESASDISTVNTYPFRWKQLLQRHWTIALALGLMTLSLSAMSSCLHWPVPDFHDEFSYLLAADTWNEGRLTNPTHPHWQHFETFHVIQQPSYASKYPIGQGLFLALGQWISGEPIVGIWILSALTAAACYWMLLGWVSARWAIAGSLMFTLHPGYQLMWGQSYWGGTLAFLGGALVFGAVARLRTRVQVRDALAMSTGTVLLAFSRPYEGSVFCIIIGLTVIAYWWKMGLPATWRELALKAVLPQALVLLIGGAGLACHNHAVTGSWCVMPYQVHEETYAISPSFLWMKPYEGRVYRHEVMTDFHNGWEMKSYYKQHTLAGLLEVKFRLFEYSWKFFLTHPMMLLLLFVPFCNTRGKWLVIVVASVAWLPSAVTVWNFPHYIAPLAPVLLVLVAMGLRHLHLLSKRTSKQTWVVPGLLAWQLMLFALVLADHAQASQEGWQWQRATVLRQLEESKGQHLVLVHYSDDHKSHREWVYNRADIDGAKVVWARSMTPDQDAKLLAYFADRIVWNLEPDAMEPRLKLARKPSDIPAGQLLTKHSP